MINKKNKIITLKSGKKYIIIEQCIYNGETYYFAGELENNKPTEDFKVLTISNDGATEKVKFVKDDSIIKAVCQIIDKITD